MRILSLLSACLLTGTIAFSQASIDTIRVGDGQLQLKYLPAGTERYLVYIEKDKVKKSVWLWERAVSKENWNGNPSIVIRQQWVTSDTGFNSRQLLSVNNEKTFAPVYHTSSNPKTGKEAYNYNDQEIVTADSVAGVGRKGFKIATAQPSFNWELDLETFSLLPLKEGKTFVVNFYHPGSSTAPAWYTYKVTGSEKLSAVNGEKVDCYKLYTEYANNRGNSTWWISKKTHEILKMEEHFGPVTRYKIKLSIAY